MAARSAGMASELRAGCVSMYIWMCERQIWARRSGVNARMISFRYITGYDSIASAAARRSWVESEATHWRTACFELGIARARNRMLSTGSVRAIATTQPITRLRVFAVTTHVLGERHRN